MSLEDWMYKTRFFPFISSKNSLLLHCSDKFHILSTVVIWLCTLQVLAFLTNLVRCSNHEMRNNYHWFLKLKQTCWQDVTVALWFGTSSKYLNFSQISWSILTMKWMENITNFYREEKLFAEIFRVVSDATKKHSHTATILYCSTCQIIFIVHI